MDISDICAMCKDDKIEVTQHALLRFYQRNISYSEVKEAIYSGEIIEDYPDDYPYPSCLILGKTNTGKNLHIVVGLSETKLWFITVYEPDINEWNSDLKTRR